VSRWWRYTTGLRLLGIIADQLVRRERKLSGEAGAVAGRTAVWFTRSEAFEPTARIAKMNRATGEKTLLTVEEMAAIDELCGLVRVQVTEDVARHTWSHHRKVSGVHPRVADNLETRARELGSDPNDWRLSYYDVPLEKVLSVEVWHQGGWIEIATQPEFGSGLAVSSWYAEHLARKTSPTAIAIRSVSPRRNPWRGISSSRLFPRTYSITRKSMPPADANSWMVTMWDG